MLLTILVYSNNLHNAFHFDDFPNIVDNHRLHHAQDITDIWQIWPTRFLNTLSLAINYHWHGLELKGYHWVSNAIHALTCFFVYLLIMLLCQTPRLMPVIEAKHRWAIALVTAGLFCVHPIQTQAVNYIYQRAVLLAAMFYILSLVLFLKAQMAVKSSQIMLTVFSLLAGVGAMLSKEHTITLPLMVVVLYMFCWQTRLSVTLRHLWSYGLLLLVIPVIWLSHHSIMDFFGPQSVAQEAYAGGVSQGEYFLSQFKVVWVYLTQMVLPLQLRVDYDIQLAQHWYEPAVVGGAGVIAMLMLVAYFLRKRFAFVSFGILWFYLTLMPESSFWANADLAFEHRLYLPSLGFLLVIVGISLPALKWPYGKERFILMALILIGVYGVLTYQRNTVWRTPLTLWDDAVKKSPRSQRAYLNRGTAYHQMGKLSEAMADYNMVIGLGPVTAVTLSNRGLIFAQWGQVDLALANFDLAIKINSGYIGTYVNRAKLYWQIGKNDLAKADYERLKEIDQPNADRYQDFIDQMSTSKEE